MEQQLPALPAAPVAAPQEQASFASAMPNINAYFEPMFAARQQGQQANIVGGLAAQQAEDEEKARRAAAARKEAELKAAIKAKTAEIDPENFKKVQKDDGGYDFFDGAGKPITAWQYAQARQEDLGKVLAGSRNEADMQFVNDWNNMQTFLQANAEGDKETLDAIYKEQPELKGMKYEQLLKEFRGSYANIFGHYQNEQGDRLNRRIVNSPLVNSLGQETTKRLQTASDSIEGVDIGGGDGGEFDFNDEGDLGTASMGSQYGVDAYNSPYQTGQNALNQQPAYQVQQKKKSFLEDPLGWMWRGGR